MWRCIWGALLCMSPLLGGCGPVIDYFNQQSGKVYAAKPVVTATGENKGMNATVRSDGLPPPLDLDSAPARKFIEASQAEATTDEARQIARLARNNLQDVIRIRSDEICDYRIAQIKGSSDAVNAGLGAVTTILGGIGAIVTGVDATRALSGSAGIVSGVRGEISSTVYQDFVVSAIIKSIEGTRQSQWVKVESKRTQMVASYGTYEAIRDVNEYHMLCSLPAALSALATQAEKIKPAELTVEAAKTELARLGEMVDGNQARIDTLKKMPAPSATTTNEISTLEQANAILATRKRLIAATMR